MNPQSLTAKEYSTGKTVLGCPAWGHTRVLHEAFLPSSFRATRGNASVGSGLTWRQRIFAAQRQKSADPSAWIGGFLTARVL